FRYPVKSMRGEERESLYISFAGVVGDRVYSFIDEKSQEDEYPYFSAYLQKELLLFTPQFCHPELLETKLAIGTADFSLEVLTPDKQKFLITDTAFISYLEKRYKRNIFLR